MFMQQVADTLGVIPVSAPFSFGATLIIGAAAALGTKFVAGAASKLDSITGAVDAKIRNGVGPALPIVTTVLGAVLPIISNKVGITHLPDAAIVANAPLSAVVGIALREATRKWLLPLIGGTK